MRKGWNAVAGAAALVVCGGTGWAFGDGAATVSLGSAEPRTASAAAESSGDQDIKPMRLSMEFQDASLRDVLKSFSQQTGINVIASDAISEQTITLYLEDVTVMDALDRILDAGNLTYERTPGSDIYIVKAKPFEDTRTVTRAYKLKYARVSKSVLAKAAESFGASTPFEGASLLAPSSGSSGGSGGGGGGGGSGGSGGGQGGGGGDVGIDTVIQTLLTTQGSITVDKRTNTLLVTDLPENFPRIEAALAALDVRTPQILVEAEVVETTMTKLKDLGVEWGSGTSGTLLTVIPLGRTTRFPWTKQFLGKFNNVNFPDAVPLTTDGVSTGQIQTNNAQMVLQALESDGETKILARPRILTLDNESALIRLTSDQVVGFNSTLSDTGATISAEPIRSTTGVILVVTPQINSNGDITMLVEPSVTKVVASVITPPDGLGDVVDPKTRSSRSLVRVRSGDTLVVGGLIDRSDVETERRVPILSGIPVLGEAFKDRETNKASSELIVFITPRIMDEYAVTPEGQASMARGMDGGTMGLREQEPNGAGGDTMESTLNALEQSSR